MQDYPEEGVTENLLYNVIIYDIIDTHYHKNLLKRTLSTWKNGLSKYHILPITNRVLVNACFQWMYTSLSTFQSNNLFPFYAVIEKHNRAEYFISRLRSYMIDKLEVKVHSLPLLFHSLAIFDASQLLNCFTAWKTYSLRCKDIDKYFFMKMRIISIKSWKRFVTRKRFLKYRLNLVQIRLKKKTLVFSFQFWKTLYKAYHYQSKNVLTQRKQFTLLNFYRFTNSHVFQRLSHKNATRFYVQKRLFNCCRIWILQLNRTIGCSFLQQEMLKSWIFESIKRSWVESKELHTMLLSLLSSRSVWFKSHRFVNYLSPTTVPSSDHRHIVSHNRHTTAAAATPTMSISKVMDPPTPYVRFKTNSLFDDTDDYDEMQPNDTSFHASALKSTVGTMLTSPLHIFSPRSSHIKSLKLSRSQKNNTNLYSTLPSLELLKKNLRSCRAQRILRSCGIYFSYFRGLTVAWFRWLYRIPQLRLDSADYFDLFFIDPKKHKMYELLQKQYSSLPTYRVKKYYYFTYKRLSYSFKCFTHYSRKLISLRNQSMKLKRIKLALRQAKAFGAWLTTTTRHQHLNRSANRIICNRINLIQWHAWYAWLHHYQRVLLVKSNHLNLIKLRNNEIQEFTEVHAVKRLHQSQYTVLKEWSMVVKDRRNGRKLISVWNHTIGMRKVYSAWNRWRLILWLDIIVNCIKKIWRGYKIRRHICRKRYNYIKQMRINIPKYLFFRKRMCRSKIFKILLTYKNIMRDMNRNSVMKCKLEMHLHRMRKYSLYCRRYRRSIKMVLSHYIRHRKINLMRKLKFRHKRLLYITKIIRYQKHLVYRRFFKYMRTVHKRKKKMLIYIKHYRYNALKRNLRSLYIRLKYIKKFRLGWLKCRRYVLRKQFYRFKRLIYLIVKIRRFQLYRLKLHSKRILRCWSRRVKFYLSRHQKARKHFERLSIKKAFRWLYFQTYKHSPKHSLYRNNSSNYNSNNNNARVTTYSIKRRRGKKDFKMIRGIISGRLKYVFIKFILFTSNRRREKSLFKFLQNKVNYIQIKIAFQKLQKDWLRVRKNNNTNKLSWRKINNDITLKKSNYNKRFNNQKSLKNIHNSKSDHHTTNKSMIRHAISRITPLTKEQIQQRMQNNIIHSCEQNLLQKGFIQWLDFYRYNSRNMRALHRLTKRHHELSIIALFKILKATLSRKRKYQNRISKISKYQRFMKLRNVTTRLKQLFQHHLKQYSILRNYINKHNNKKKRFFYLCMYSKCYFRRLSYKLLCIKKLKTKVQLAFKKLRYKLWKNRYSPSAKAAQRYNFIRKRYMFRRMRVYHFHYKFKNDILRVSSIHRLIIQAARMIRYWRRYVKLKHKLKYICRRMILKPILNIWHSSTNILIRDNDNLISIINKQNHRIRIFVMNHWKLFFMRSFKLRQLSEKLKLRVALMRKHVCLYKWMHSIDKKIMLNKFQSVSMLSQVYMKRRYLFHWHKQALLSELCTWKSARNAFRNLHLRSKSTKYQYNMYHRAVAYNDAYLVQAYLYIWYKIVAQMRRQIRRRNHVFRQKQYKNTLIYFRKWKRRMYLIYKSRGCYLAQPLHLLSYYEFHMRRAMFIWHRISSGSVKRYKLNILKANLICLREHCYKQRYARMAFINRLKICRWRWQLLSIWNILLNNATKLKVQRSLTVYTTMVIKNKVWQFWRKLYQLRKREKSSLYLISSLVYVLDVRRVFLIWKIKTKISDNLARQSLQSHAWIRWRKVLSSQLQWRYGLQEKIFKAWKLYLNSMDIEKRIQLHRRRHILKVVIRKMRSYELKLFVAFLRWKTEDDSILLCKYNRYSKLLSDHYISSSTDPPYIRDVKDGFDNTNANTTWKILNLLPSEQQQNEVRQYKSSVRLEAIRFNLRKKIAFHQPVVHKNTSKQQHSSTYGQLNINRSSSANGFRSNHSIDSKQRANRSQSTSDFLNRKATFSLNTATTISQHFNPTTTISSESKEAVARTTIVPYGPSINTQTGVRTIISSHSNHNNSALFTPSIERINSVTTTPSNLSMLQTRGEYFNVNELM